MIYWLTQTHAELPESAQIVRKNGGFLNKEEHTCWPAFKTSKRRDDWLLGRWTAKRLLQTVLWEKNGMTLSLDMITIMNDADGVPDYRLPFAHHQYSLSISHSHKQALVALIEKPNAHVGADMELIEPRPTGFADNYFTPAEIALGHKLVGQERAVWETAVWSAKESVLKVWHLGLSVDTRTISCQIEPVDSVPQVWLPFVIKKDNGRLPHNHFALSGWWRVKDNFVLTIVVGNYK